LNEDELTSLFERLGARDPRGWARSQIEEGFPQLARYLFLRQAWENVVAEDDATWIEEQLETPPDGPGGAINGALRRVLEKDVSKTDLTAIVRVMQWQFLFKLCYLLDGPSIVEPEAQDVRWQLFQVDDEGRPTAAINGLHESVLETEPTGREMCPPA